MKTRSFLIIAAAALAAFGAWRYLTAPDNAKPATTVMVVESAPTTVAPLSVADLGSSTISALIHSPLVLVNPAGEVVPVLADKIEVEADALSARITLNPKARFSDGSLVTGEDVAASLTGLRDSTSPLRVAMERLSSCEVISASEVVVHFAKPEPDFTKLAACLSASIVKKGTDKQPKLFLDSQVIGAGAWRMVIEESSPGQQYFFERNEGFPIKSAANRLIVKVMPSHQVALAAFSKGEIDVYRLRGPAVTEAIQDGALRPEFAKGRLARSAAADASLGFVNWASPKFGSLTKVQRKNLHRQLVEAVPRSEIAKTMGKALPLNHIVPAACLQLNDVPAVAEEAVKWSVTAPLEILVANDAQSRQLGTLIQAVFSKLGVDTTTRSAEIGDLVGAIMKKDYDVAVTYIEAALDSPVTFLQFFTEGSPYAAFGQEVKGLREKMENARGILAPDVRRAAWAETVAWLETQQTAWVPIVSRDSLVLLSDRVEGEMFESTGTTNWSFLTLRP